MAEDLCKTRQKRKKRVKYEQKYKSEYRDEFKCINKSLVGNTFAFCNLCRCDVNIAHGGRDDLRKHCLMQKHVHVATAAKCQPSVSSIVNVCFPWCGKLARKPDLQWAMRLLSPFLFRRSQQYTVGRAIVSSSPVKCSARQNLPPGWLWQLQPAVLVTAAYNMTLTDELTLTVMYVWCIYVEN